ncbi:arsenate reductase [Algoriphagus ratkowskyi]|uniref:Arsenate reductase n=1 Tax=Algoriphagus ratkowskyi TaxID=57028 RepID=A0A2W7R4K8_9BACT|nr:glutaredoxin [Algoriphagus ratkowskyi]PZX55424.1 arsenate reductase [Algoriphagus ratkowskyi]TXD79653.1 glutaredoxin [Algoriphagus ratkowskyi]
MKTHPSELYFYHSPSQQIDKQTLAYAKSIYQFVNTIDLSKERLTPTQWNTLLLKLNLRAKDLLNRAHPDYQKNIAGKNWDDESWLNILIKSPNLIKAPIASLRQKAILCITPTDILKLNSRRLA